MPVGDGKWDGNPCNMTCLCVACVQEMIAKPKASLLSPLPAWKLGPGVLKFHNRKDGFLTKYFMVNFFPPCCSYPVEDGK